jgi:hypothetical protein
MKSLIGILSWTVFLVYMSLTCGTRPKEVFMNPMGSIEVVLQAAAR